MRRVELRLMPPPGAAHLDLCRDRPGDEHRDGDRLGTEPLRIGAERRALDGAATSSSGTTASSGSSASVRHAAFFRFRCRWRAARSTRRSTPRFVQHGQSRVRVLRFRPLRAQRRAGRRWSTGASPTWPAHRVRHRDHRPAAFGRRRDHPDGATRIAGNKLRRQESFEQLVDPQRTIPEAGIPIHGIEPAMVEGKPTIGEVLLAFHVRPGHGACRAQRRVRHALPAAC